MKKMIMIILCCLALTLPAKANNQTVNVYANNYNFSGMIVDSTSYVSLRDYLDALYGCNISWDGTKASAIIDGYNFSVNQYELTIRLSQRVVYCSDIKNISGRLWVPVRKLSGILNNSIEWDNKTKSVHIQKGVISDYAYNEQDLYWLSRIIEAESGWEQFKGKIAVGNVILNRVKSDQFPNTVYDVIFDNSYAVQFTPTANGAIYNTPSVESIDAAKQCIEGRVEAKNCLYFVNPKKSPSNWIISNRKLGIIIGNHNFYY